MNIVKILKAIAIAAPRNDCRDYLNTVRIERADDHINVVVTDGHFLMKMETSLELVPEFNAGDSVLITRSSLVTALKTVKIGDEISLLKVNDRWTLNNLNRGYASLEEHDGTYPDWRRVWMDKQRNVSIDCGIGVESHILVEALKVMESINKTSPMLMTVGDSTECIKFQAKSELPDGVFDISCIIMPCKI